MATEDHRTNLLGLGEQELAGVVARMGERPYRGAQLYRWLYRKGVNTFAGMTDLSREFRERLAAGTVIEGIHPEHQRVSSADGTTKFLFTLRDGLHIETVLIPADASEREAGESMRSRLTLCVSTQVGCALDCAFCATGTMGYLRNLSTGEIIDQVLQVRRISGRRITNVVFMGMGEPMMNYAAVMVAAGIMVHGMQIAARRITVSTAGWVDGIRKMADERRRVKLALSLHSVSDEVRSRLMPVNRRHGLEDILRALEYYYGRTGMRPTYEYIFFDGVNDSPEEIRRLIRFARAVPCKINVIPYHSIAFTHPQGLGAALRPSLRVEAIVEELRAANLTVMIRSNAGEDITAACGQLAAGQRRNRNTAGTHHRGPASPTYSQRHTQRHATTTFRASGSGEGNTGETPR